MRHFLAHLATLRAQRPPANVVPPSHPARPLWKAVAALGRAAEPDGFSPFHDGTPPRICAHPQGGYAMWAEVLDRAAPVAHRDPAFRGAYPGGAFLTEYLLPANQTLAAWIADITKGNA